MIKSWFSVRIFFVSGPIKVKKVRIFSIIADYPSFFGNGWKQLEAIGRDWKLLEVLETLKSNTNVQYAVLTGILQVSKESILSGLNNLVVNTVLDYSMDEGFGFTEEEVDELIHYYGLESQKESFEEWYDGYLFGKAKIYNPISVLTAIKNEGLFEPYWSNTSENGALYELLKKIHCPLQISPIYCVAIPLSQE